MDRPANIKDINANEPTVMHVDLNSCFATIEQQANPLLRGKPIAVAAYASSNGCVLAPSNEAKQYGIKVGMRVGDAKLLCRELQILTPDPPKYRDVHLKLRNLFRDYSPLVAPKSIDEAVINFAGTAALKTGLTNIGKEIKVRIRQEIGDWISCNVGIGTNRFLAKTAASLHKPDGLDVITKENLIPVYRSLKLTDLCGINRRYEARLNTAGIFTPVEFLMASLDTLKQSVFRGINGYYWFLRLRGWEIDDVEFRRRTIGHSYALPDKTNDPAKLSRLLMKLCVKTGRRLRQNDSSASGVHVTCVYTDHTYWHKGMRVNPRVYSDVQLFRRAQSILKLQPVWKRIVNLAVNCYDLQPTRPEQLSIFDTDLSRQKSIAQAVDKINNRYGEFVVTPASMMGMNEKIIDRISFGGVKDLEDLYLNSSG